MTLCSVCVTGLQFLAQHCRNINTYFHYQLYNTLKPYFFISGKLASLIYLLKTITVNNLCNKDYFNHYFDCHSFETLHNTLNKVFPPFIMS